MKDKVFFDLASNIEKLYLAAGRIIFGNLQTNGYIDISDKSISQGYDSIKEVQINTIKYNISKLTLDNDQKSSLLDKLKVCDEYLFHSMKEGNLVLLSKLANTYILEQIANKIFEAFSPDQIEKKQNNIKNFIKLFENTNLINTSLYLSKDRKGNKEVKSIENNQNISKIFSEILSRNKMIDKSGYLKNFESLAKDKIDEMNKLSSKSVLKITSDKKFNQSNINQVLTEKKLAKTVKLPSNIVDLDLGDDSPKELSSDSVGKQKDRKQNLSMSKLSKKSNETIGHLGDTLKKEGVVENKKKNIFNRLLSSFTRNKSKNATKLDHN